MLFPTTTILFVLLLPLVVTVITADQEQNQHSLRSMISDLVTNTKQITTAVNLMTDCPITQGCLFEVKNLGVFKADSSTGVICHFEHSSTIDVCYGGYTYDSTKVKYYLGKWYDTMPTGNGLQSYSNKQCPNECDFDAYYVGDKKTHHYHFQAGNVCTYLGTEIYSYCHNELQGTSPVNVITTNPTWIAAYPYLTPQSLATTNRFCDGCTYRKGTAFFYAKFPVKWVNSYDPGIFTWADKAVQAETPSVCKIDDWASTLVQTCYDGLVDIPSRRMYANTANSEKPGYAWNSVANLKCNNQCDLGEAADGTVIYRYSEGFPVCKYGGVYHYQTCSRENYQKFLTYPNWLAAKSSVPVCSGCTFGSVYAGSTGNSAAVQLAGYYWYFMNPDGSACPWRYANHFQACSPADDKDYGAHLYGSVKTWSTNYCTTCTIDSGVLAINNWDMYYYNDVNGRMCHYSSWDVIYHCNPGGVNRRSFGSLPWHTNHENPMVICSDCAVEHSKTIFDDIEDWTEDFGQHVGALVTNNDVFNYFKNDFVGDLEQVGDAMQDFANDVCAVPGAKFVLKLTCSQLLKFGVCTATKGRAPGCVSPLTLTDLAKIAAIKQIIKCASFEALKASKIVCNGIADYISDALGDLYPSGQYDEVCSAAIECLCTSCPGTCGYSNNAVTCNPQTYVNFYQMVF
jgi:hypothetical protein